jgi:hypothetical protein
MGIIYDANRRCFYSTTTKQRLTGLHNCLEKRFYRIGSNFSTVKQLRFKNGKKKKAKNGSTRRSDRGGMGKLMSGKIAQYRTPSGMGNFIDGQFGNVVNKAIEACPDSVSHREHVYRVWTRQANQTVIVPAGVPKIPAEPRYKYHPYIKPGFRALLAKGLIPLLCQVVVGSEERRVATKLDMMAWDKNRKQVAVIEVKSGYEGIWDVNTGAKTLMPPLESIPDTPHNKAHLQALCGAFLAKATFGYNYTPRAYVLHMDSHGAKLESTPKDMLAQSAQIMARFGKVSGG